MTSLVRGSILGLFLGASAIFGMRLLPHPNNEPNQFRAPAHARPLAKTDGRRAKSTNVARRSNSSVRQASFSAPLASVLLAPIAVGDVTLIKVQDGSYAWPLDAVTVTQPLRLIGNQAIIQVNAGSDQTIKVLDGTTEVNNQALTTGDNTITLPTLSAGSHTIEIRNVPADGANEASLFKITLIVSGEANAPAKPVVKSVLNGKHVQPELFVSSTKYQIFGQSPYIRLEGESLSPDNRLRFFVTDGATIRAEIADVRRGVLEGLRGGWTAEFNLSPDALAPGDPGTEGQLLILSEKEKGSHSYASVPVKVLVRTVNQENLTLDTAKVTGATFSESTRFFLLNKTSLELTGTDDIPNDVQIVAYRHPDMTLLGSARGKGTADWAVPIQGLGEGIQRIIIALEQGDQELPNSETTLLTVHIRTQGPRVVAVEPENFGTAPGVTALTVTFSPENPLAQANAEDFQSYELLASNGSGVFDRGTELLMRQATTGGQTPRPVPIRFDAIRNSVTIAFADMRPDIYQLRVFSSRITDLFGNRLEGVERQPGTDFVQVLGTLPDDATDAAELSVRPGISGATGKYVKYTEFTKFRRVPPGFNPNDKVETRVARLYYYRDAHRVAQIINRKAKSHNRQGVDMARQLADKARTEADQVTQARQHVERLAIIKSQETRRIERQLESAEQTLNRTLQDLTSARQQGVPPDDPQIQQMEAVISSLSAQVKTLRADVEQARDEEIAANEEAQQLDGQEKTARDEQFRREVAAAHSDPDTFAEGEPESDDPVEQVSVSVIGEGLIHLRGPLKGINVIRTMIDQIDQPVGQVRVSVHTVQINGEKEQRMENVANIVQLYIDHARFLTMQSAEMLRNAVVQVAGRKAEEATALYPGDTQEDRDRRYLYAFFGKDFIDELEVMDSEFLKTGNKLLSLHSMDTTSLSSALNLLALAKNSTREEIFQEFDRLVQTELPHSEDSYLEAGLTARKKHKLDLHCPPKFYPMAQNAKFESLRGFFKVEVGNDDTMTPLQREFVRLAQIFKSRLVTELEYKQRVMERAIIEDRIKSTYLEQLQQAADEEDKARKVAQDAASTLAEERPKVVAALADALSQGEAILQSAQDASKFSAVQVEERSEAQDSWDRVLEGVPSKCRRQLYRDSDDGAARMDSQVIEMLEANEVPPEIVKSLQSIAREVQGTLDDTVRRLQGSYEFLRRFRYTRENKDAFLRIQKLSRSRKEPKEALREAYDDPRFQNDDERLRALSLDAERLSNAIEAESSALTAKAESLIDRFHDPKAKVIELYREWRVLRELIDQRLWLRPSSESDEIAPELNDLLKTLNAAELAIKRLLDRELAVQTALERVEITRRPLDHKKFLDMLIDDLEEKYIELLDGTRAHTANVDNYLKRLTTALDDDFNTQFYHPAMRYVRETSTYWDVQFGQTESTSILANNREFAKVEPGATMEFDLPHRDIAFAEALNGARALMDDVGALATDPTFLAMAKNSLNSPASPPPGSTGGLGVVRDVLPGLDTSTAEDVMAHNAGERPQLGSNLENLIPDPAIYKFETGTGFEIRPVVQPDGQAVVFDFNYMYTTNIREPVRADEKHLGRVKRHYIDTDVQLSNFELREVSRYNVALKAARTSRGVPLLEDIPLAGVMFRPLPSDESSLQQNLILAQATIFPTLFDLMGLRWAPAVSDLDPLRVSNREFIARGRHRELENRVYDYASDQVDEFLRIPEANRRTDLYRTQESVPYLHPNGYQGPGLDLRDSQLQEGYQPGRAFPENKFIPGESKEGAPFRPGRDGMPRGTSVEPYPLDEIAPSERDPGPILEPSSSSRRTRNP